MPEEQSRAAWRNAGNFNRADRAFLEFNIEVPVARQQVRSKLGQVGLVPNKKHAIETVAAHLDEDFRKSRRCALKCLPRSERFQDLDLALHLERNCDRL